MTDSELQNAIDTTQPVKQESTPAPQDPNFDPLAPFLTILNLLNRPRNYLSAAPTFIPQNLVDQIQFVDDGADKWLYIYVNKVWVGIKDGSGGSGTPAGSNTQLQYNNGGAFGGITGATSNGTEVTLNQPTITSFASANHDHSNGSQGGQLNASGVFSAGTVPVGRLPIMVGDSGSGGTAGLVPTPATGDGSKYLKGDGTFDTPATAGFSSRVRATLDTDQSIPGSSGYTIVEFEVKDFDGRGEYDPTTFTFTADETGYYLVTVMMDLNVSDLSQAGTSNFYIHKNGSAYGQAHYFNSMYQTPSILVGPTAKCTDIVPLSAGDDLDIRAIINSGSTVHIIHGYLAIHRLS